MKRMILAASITLSLGAATAVYGGHHNHGADTIVDVAVDNGNFTTLVTALQATGLDKTLTGSGPFTVFAPTDEAFAKLPAGTVESLLNDKEALAEILTYHVVSGKVTSDQVVKLDSADTVAGPDVTISVNGDTVKVNQSTVVAVDVPASNGVIHVIDTVLMPPKA
ncbi:MAG: fasciclin domain-containing protein [Wenzhouxiangellaceae bacterium]